MGQKENSLKPCRQCRKVAAWRFRQGVAAGRPCRQQAIVCISPGNLALIPPTEDLSIRTTVYPTQLTGPVRYDWLAQAARVAGRTKGLHLACALAWLAALHGRPDVPLTRRTMARWSLSRDIVGKALATLREHGLVLTWAAPGRARIVVLTEPGTVTPLVIA